MAVKRKSSGTLKSWPVVTAAALKLPRQCTVAYGLQVIAANCLAQIRGNEPGVVHGGEPECLHQMRVGLRRLNSALKLFRRYAPCPTEVLADLAWIQGKLGAVREWDVLADDTLAEILTAEKNSDWLASLRPAVLAQAYQNRQRLQTAVMSARYMHCLSDLEKWLAGLDNGAAARSLSEFARQLLFQQRAQLRERGEKLFRGSARRRHRTRIAAKKVRYATEFFRSWYPAAQVRPYLKALAELQEVLGWLNDAAVAARLLTQLAQQQLELSYNSGFVQGYLAARSRREVRRLGRLWRHFLRIPVPDGEPHGCHRMDIKPSLG